MRLDTTCLSGQPELLVTLLEAVLLALLGNTCLTGIEPTVCSNVNMGYDVASITNGARGRQADRPCLGGCRVNRI